LIPKDLKYTKSHEWVKTEGERVRVGITHHAQRELGDIVFVELPPLGKKARKGERMAAVESVKAVGTVYAPLSGEVVEVNTAVTNAPDLINREPYGQGWLFVLKMDNPGELADLMDAAGYAALIGG